MSVRCEMFLGWTVKLIEGDVTSEDFEFFEESLEEREPDFIAFKGKYSEFTDDGTKVKLVVDGMNGLYVRLIYVHKNKPIISFGDEIDYEKLSNEQVPDDIYNELNECYKKIYNKDLERDKVEYALWHHWS